MFLSFSWSGLSVQHASFDHTRLDSIHTIICYYISQYHSDTRLFRMDDIADTGPDAEDKLYSQYQTCDHIWAWRDEVNRNHPVSCIRNWLSDENGIWCLPESRMTPALFQAPYQVSFPELSPPLTPHQIRVSAASSPVIPEDLTPQYKFVWPRPRRELNHSSWDFVLPETIHTAKEFNNVYDVLSELTESFAKYIGDSQIELTAARMPPWEQYCEEPGHRELWNHWEGRTRRYVESLLGLVSRARELLMKLAVLVVEEIAKDQDQVTGVLRAQLSSEARLGLTYVFGIMRRWFGQELLRVFGKDLLGMRLQ